MSALCVRVVRVPGHRDAHVLQLEQRSSVESGSYVSSRWDYSTATFEQTAGSRTGFDTRTTKWTLQLHSEAATLTMIQATSTTPLVLDGLIDATNGGVPHPFHQLDGPRDTHFHEYPTDVRVTGSSADIPVHSRGATLRYRCGGSTPHDGGWTDEAAPVHAIKCTLGEVFDGMGRVILFANSCVEQIELVCAEHDVVGQLHAAYRLAGTK